MEQLDHVLRLRNSGRFGDALRALEEAPVIRAQRFESAVLRTRLLEHVGQSDQALSLATHLLRSRQLNASGRSQCEMVLGRLLLDKGDIEDGLAHLQRSVLLAQQASDLHALFDAKLKFHHPHLKRHAEQCRSWTLKPQRSSYRQWRS